MQLKEQKRKGKAGPLKLQKVVRKPSGVGSKNDGSDDDDDNKFTNITAQLAWERDIDLTKGQAFLKDPGVIENAPISPRNIVDVKNNFFDVKNTKVSNNNTETPTKKTETSPPPNNVPNGNAPRVIRKYVKKPNGTPKTSPKVQKQFHFNRVSPLPLYEKDSIEDETDFDATLKEGFAPATQRQFIGDKSGLSSVKISEEEEEGLSLVNVDDDEVGQASHDISHDISRDITIPHVHVRPGSADSRTKYDQWVDELIDISPATSPGKHDKDSPDGKKSKGKKRKKDKRDKKETDKKKDGARKSEGKSKGNRTPTSDDVLLVDDSDMNDETVL